MKKILALLLLVIVLTLSGCATTSDLEKWDNEDRLEFIDGLRDCYDVNFDNQDCNVQDVRFYTKEEVDELLGEYEYYQLKFEELEQRIEELESRE